MDIIEIAVILLIACLVLVSIGLGLGLGVLLTFRRRDVRTSNRDDVEAQTQAESDRITPSDEGILQTAMTLLRDIRDNQVISGWRDVGISTMALVVALVAIGIAAQNSLLLTVSLYLLAFAIALNVSVFFFLIVRRLRRRDNI